jgi:hypothetical protein
MTPDGAFVRPVSVKRGIGMGVFIGFVVFVMLVLLSLGMRAVGFNAGARQRSAQLQANVAACIDLVRSTSSFWHDTLPQMLRDSIPRMLEAPPRGVR